MRVDREEAISAETVRVVARRGPHPDRRDPARAGARRRRGRRVGHRAGHRAAAAGRPGRLGPRPAVAAARAGRRRRRRRGHRHDRPGVAQRPDRPGHRRRRPAAAGRPARPRRRARQRPRGHRSGSRRRGGLGRRPGQGQARPAARSPWSAGSRPAPRARTARAAAALVRPADEDLFRLGGRASVVPRPAYRPRVHRRAGRPRGAAPGGRGRRHRAGTAPHDAVAVRASSTIPTYAGRCSTRCSPPGWPTCVGTASPTSRSRSGTRRGDVLRGVPHPRRAVPGPATGCTTTPTRGARRPSGRCSSSRWAPASRTCSSPWPSRASGRPGCSSTMFCRDVVRARARPARRLGADGCGRGRPPRGARTGPPAARPGRLPAAALSHIAR